MLKLLRIYQGNVKRLLIISFEELKHSKKGMSKRIIQKMIFIFQQQVNFMIRTSFKKWNDWIKLRNLVTLKLKLLMFFMQFQKKKVLKNAFIKLINHQPESFHISHHHNINRHDNGSNQCLKIAMSRLIMMTQGYKKLKKYRHNLMFKAFKKICAKTQKCEAICNLVRVLTSAINPNKIFCFRKIVFSGFFRKRLVKIGNIVKKQISCLLKCGFFEILQGATMIKHKQDQYVYKINVLVFSLRSLFGEYEIKSMSSTFIRLKRFWLETPRYSDMSELRFSNTIKEISLINQEKRLDSLVQVLASIIFKKTRNNLFNGWKKLEFNFMKKKSDCLNQTLKKLLDYISNLENKEAEINKIKLFYTIKVRLLNDKLTIFTNQFKNIQIGSLKHNYAVGCRLFEKILFMKLGRIKGYAYSKIKSIPSLTRGSSKKIDFAMTLMKIEKSHRIKNLSKFFSNLIIFQQRDAFTANKKFFKMLATLKKCSFLKLSSAFK